MSAAPQRLNKYELRTQIGHGSVGEVWKAYDLQHHQDVALKLLHTDLQSDPHFFTRFNQEGSVIASLQHDNIIKIHEVNVARPAQSNETIAYIAMDYIEGQTLGEYMQKTSQSGALPSIAQIVYLFTSLGLAIDYAHQKGVIHGNLKPGNILLNRHDKFQFEAGEPILTDFALANLLGSDVTVTSPYYISPEQARGQAANSRSDIYALGVILYELCTGVQPFRAASAIETMKQHINALPTPPVLINQQIPNALSEVVLRAMAKNPATRFSTASALASAVADACSLQSTFYSPPRPGINDNEDDEQDDQPSLPILGVAQPPNTNTARRPRITPASPLRSTPSLSGLIPGQRLTPNQVEAVPGPQPGNFLVENNVVQQDVDTPTISQPLPLTPPVNQPLPVKPTPSQPVITSEIRQEMRPTQVTQAVPTVLPPARHRRSSDMPLPIVIVSLVLLLVVITTIIGASLLHKQPATTTPAAVPQQMAHVFFQDDALGFNDQLRFDLQNVNPAPANKSYYAWLKTQDNKTQPLGQLSVQNHSISFLYAGNSNHTNLLSIIQGIEITLEDTGSNPHAPSTQVAFAGQFNTATLQQLQNILYVTPDFPGHQSVVRGLLDTIKSMNDKAGSINDSLSRDPQLARRQAIRIIELIDGTDNARKNGDLPANEPALLNTQVGLLAPAQGTGYIDTLATRLEQLKHSSPSTDTQLLQHIQNVENAITDLQSWVQQIRGYAETFVKAKNLGDPALASTGLQLQQITADAYTGRTIPPHQGPQPILGSAGAYQAYVEAQYLAALDLQKQ